MTRLVSILVVLAGVLASPASVSHWNGGRVPPLHKIQVLDPEGETISPSERPARPVSTERTCAQCHDLAAMKGGSHFRVQKAADSVNKEPWFIVDSKTGTQLPVSSPAEAGMTAWEWSKEFGRHFPGGGIAEDAASLDEAGGARSRWFVTGALEKNCFACHAQNHDYDHSEWVRQIARENFQGAATAALGIADVKGMNSRMPDYWHWSLGANRDDKVFAVPMTVEYDRAKFDSKNRVSFDLGKPRSANCLACHSATERGMASHKIEGDAHLRAGMTCTDCHSNGIDHKMRTVSCAECHIGDAQGKTKGPKPNHIGIPLVHFEKLSCAVCHSGVTADGAVAEVRTSRANRIGVYGRAQWDTAEPYIQEPVFVKNSQGKVELCRVMWPAYFAKADGALLKPEEVLRLAGEVLNSATNFNTEVLSAALGKMGKEYCYIGHGYKMTLGETDELEYKALENGGYVTWPIAHDVRSGGMARGAGAAKCADCHTADSKFFFGKVAAKGPITDFDESRALAAGVGQVDMLAVGENYHRLFGFTFMMRPLFKLVLWSVFGFLLVSALASVAAVLPKLFDCVDRMNKIVRFVDRVSAAALCAASIYLAASGFCGWAFGGMTGWWLMLHMVAGGVFAAGAVVVAVLRFKRKSVKSLVVWMLLMIALVMTVWSAVMPMMTVFGTKGQEVLLVWHRVSAAAFVVLAAVMCVMRRIEIKKKVSDGTEA